MAVGTSSDNTFKGDLQRRAINVIWGTNLTDGKYREHEVAYSAYFHHIYRQLWNAACSGDEPVSDSSHEKVLQIVSQLKREDKVKRELLSLVPLGAGWSQLQIERAVNLAAGLLVPLNFGGIGGLRPGKQVTWNSDESLRQLVTRQATALAPSTRILQHLNCEGCSAHSSRINFPKRFSAWQLRFVAGFDIVWTNNLLDHLALDEEKLEVHIFHHVKVLMGHKECQGNIIPLDLVQETFDTMALLFPRTDRKVRKWYDKLDKTYKIDPLVFRCNYLKLEDRHSEHFKYWGTRLLKLKGAFDAHEPTGPAQWWRDDRKPVQWWTFWVAVLVLGLTLLFGFTQSITAILQLVRS